MNVETIVYFGRNANVYDFELPTNRPTNTNYVEKSLPESTKTIEMKYRDEKPVRNILLGETILARGGEAFQNLRGDRKLRKEKLGAGNEEKKKKKI